MYVRFIFVVCVLLLFVIVMIILYFLYIIVCVLFVSIKSQCHFNGARAAQQLRYYVGYQKIIYLLCGSSRVARKRLGWAGWVRNIVV